MNMEQEAPKAGHVSDPPALDLRNKPPADAMAEIQKMAADSSGIFSAILPDGNELLSISRADLNELVKLIGSPDFKQTIVQGIEAAEKGETLPLDIDNL